jgi:hypothetical protein
VAVVCPRLEDSNVIRAMLWSGGTMLPHRRKEGGICIASFVIFCTRPDDEGFYALDMLSIGEDRRPVRLL